MGHTPVSTIEVSSVTLLIWQHGATGTRSTHYVNFYIQNNWTHFGTRHFHRTDNFTELIRKPHSTKIFNKKDPSSHYFSIRLAREVTDLSKVNWVGFRTANFQSIIPFHPYFQEINFTADLLR